MSKDSSDTRSSTGSVLGSGSATAPPCVALRLCKSGETVPLGEVRRFSIGTSPECELALDDAYVSATHCIIERGSGGRTLVRDRRSKNGTYLDGNRIELAELRPGAVLRVGNTTMIALGVVRHAGLGALAQLRGEHPEFRRAVALATRAAESDCSVLIVGETGTGKELVAQAVHEASPRRTGPLVAINCGAIGSELIGSELFGHERGAFTGATTARDGVFIQACGGTLFLDEVGELPLEQQPHLLRVLETRSVRRVGGNRNEPVDVRLVAATNRLEHLGEAESRLRLDLYHRLATVIVHLPPLRERAEDIPLLVQAFMDEFAEGLGPRRIDRHTMRTLCSYPWPGNVRELRQAIKRAMTLCAEELTIEHLLPSLAGIRPMTEILKVPRQRMRSARGSLRVFAPPAGALRPIDFIIRDAMLDALDKNRSLRSAAESLGIPKSTFADWARRLGIALRETS